MEYVLSWHSTVYVCMYRFVHQWEKSIKIFIFGWMWFFCYLHGLQAANNTTTVSFLLKLFGMRLFIMWNTNCFLIIYDKFVSQKHLCGSVNFAYFTRVLRRKKIQQSIIKQNLISFEYVKKCSTPGEQISQLQSALLSMGNLFVIYWHIGISMAFSTVSRKAGPIALNGVHKISIPWV